MEVTTLCAILSVYVCNYIIRQYVSAVNIKSFSAGCSPEHNSVFVVQYFQCVNKPKANWSLLKQSGKKTSRRQSPSA